MGPKQMGFKASDLWNCQIEIWLNSTYEELLMPRVAVNNLAKAWHLRISIPYRAFWIWLLPRLGTYKYVQVRTYTYILYLACFQPMPLIYVQIHAYTYIYQRIHTYTYIYMKIRMLNDKVWIVGRCQCPAVTRTRCRPAPDTDWDCQWAARWPLTGHRSPAASGPGRLGGGWACHWPCCRDAGGLPLSVTGRPPWRRTNEWKNWAYQADPILWQCQLSSTGLCI